MDHETRLFQERIIESWMQQPHIQPIQIKTTKSYYTPFLPKKQKDLHPKHISLNIPKFNIFAEKWWQRKTIYFPIGLFR